MKLYAGAFITDWLVGAVPKSDKWNKMRHPHHPEKIHVESQLAQSLCGHCTLISSRPHASMWVDKVLGATVFSSFRATYTFAGQQFIRPGLDGPGSRCWNVGGTRISDLTLGCNFVECFLRRQNVYKFCQKRSKAFKNLLNCVLRKFSVQLFNWICHRRRWGS